jgi:hypothetical protein
MKKTIRAAAALLGLSPLILSLHAQTAAPTGSATPSDPIANAQPLIDAAQTRANMITAIVQGSEQADAALVRLKTIRSASGLSVDSDTDLAYAAIDIGQCLLAQNKAAEAMKFFRAAEIALTLRVKATPDSNPASKAQYLKQLAFIRGKFLTEADQAKLDIDQAISLQPDDQQLRQVKAQIGKEHGDIFNDLPTPSSN